MRHPGKSFATCALLSMAGLLASCSTVSPPKATVTPPPPRNMLASIDAAGASDHSVIAVTPLRDPGTQSLQSAAEQDIRMGQYAAAAGKLDQAITLQPDSPELLQDRAEVAVRLKDYATAERLAHQSWSIGPKLGPLCARNWQTIVEMRHEAGDAAGVIEARKQVKACQKSAIPRY